MLCISHFPEKSTTLGVRESGFVFFTQLSASSRDNVYSGARNARLYNYPKGPFTFEWERFSFELRPWVQVDLVVEYVLSGLLSQGKSQGSVTTHATFKYSEDGNIWLDHLNENGDPKVSPIVIPVPKLMVQMLNGMYTYPKAYCQNIASYTLYVIMYRSMK